MRFSRGIGFLAASALTFVVPALATDFNVSLLSGTKGGASVRVGGMVSDFARGFPLALELSAAYSWRDGGNAIDARRIFINDNTNGTPEKAGHYWDLRLDFLYRAKVFGIQEFYLYAGPRIALFSAHFDYIGGNEDFDVTSDQVGIGIGGRASFPMGNRLALTLLGGVDHYFTASLYGHDTTYSPDNENVNAKHDYTYSTADEAINQPRWVPVLMIGVALQL